MTASAFERDPNDVQRGAADPKASVWVAASAGTGKTKVLTDRVLRLLLAGTPPERILCLTFTKAAAAEMNNRLAEVLKGWASAPGEILERELVTVLGRQPDDEDARGARSLFARILDVPGGMRILTIHAFCQTVLGRFPLEAGIAPHFEVLDERDQSALMAAAKRFVFADASCNRALGGALSEITKLAGEATIDALLDELAGDRHKLRAATGAFGSIEALISAVTMALGRSPGETPESVLALASDGSAFDRVGLQSAAAALSSGSSADAKRGVRISNWLVADPKDRCSSFFEYAGAFLTKAGGIRSTLVTASVDKRHPNVREALEVEAERVRNVIECWRTAVVASATVALVRLGSALLDRYARLKQREARLDFDDLIDTTAALIGRDGGASWVLYKLDGGIDHVLIDEAQDTSPRQWAVIQALTSDFFAGAGARDVERTVFAVGDVKQSIFSFQGAQPDRFVSARDDYGRHVRAASGDWREINLEASFRSTRAVLAAVDATFARSEASDGVSLDGLPVIHRAYRLRDGGSVELWPPVRARETDTPPPWSPPVERVPGDSPQARLATLLARRIREMIGREPLDSKGRSVRAGDIMVLVRRRGTFMEDLVRRLKAESVPVAGVDRMVLTEQLAIMDLMALGHFALLPDDDLTLACVLKSPLVGLDEEQLFQVAHKRESSLWAALNAGAGASSLLQAARERLAEVRARADTVTPFDFYAEVLGPLDGRRRLLARLGHEADDPIAEFMDLALHYERSHPPSLQGFLDWVERYAVEVKRDLEQEALDAVRVLTVHGAKGLQAPIVFLPDTMNTPKRLPSLLWPRTGPQAHEEILVWPPRAEHRAGIAEAEHAAAKRRQAEEYRRLLYVAMTRSEDRLVVCGWGGKQREPDDCWYNLIKAGLLADSGKRVALETVMDPFLAAASEIEEAEVLRIRCPQETAAKTPGEPLSAEISPLPAWARAPAPTEAAPSRPLAPSRSDGEDGPVDSPMTPGSGVAAQRGRLIHRLLQSLPDHAPERREDVARHWLARPVHGLSPDEQADIAATALSVLDHPECVDLFGSNGRAEVPLSGVTNGVAISGQVDRLLVTDAAISVLDFKTDRTPPVTSDAVPVAYLRQMAAYRAVLQCVYPGRPVRSVLLWTAGPSVMQLEDAALDRYAPGSIG